MAKRKSPPHIFWEQLPASFGFRLATDRGGTLAHVWKGCDGLWHGTSSSPNSIVYGPYGSDQEAKSALAIKV